MVRGRVSGTIRVVLLAMLAPGLAACAGAPGRGFDESAVFADPAHYSLYDCKQLAAAHQSHAGRVEELKRLMAKAETGPAGSVMSELAYRSDYLSAQAQLKAVNAAMARNRCGSEGAVQTPAPAAPVAGHSAGRLY